MTHSQPGASSTTDSPSSVRSPFLRLRLDTVAAVAVGFAIVATATWWVIPRLAASAAPTTEDRYAGLPAMVLVLLAMIVGSVPMTLLGARWAARQRALGAVPLVVERGGFVVGPGPEAQHGGAAMVLLFAWIAVIAPGPGPRLSVSGAVVLAIVASVVALRIHRAPRLTVTSDGILLRNLRTRVVSWADMAPPGPAVHEGRPRRVVIPHGLSGAVVSEDIPVGRYWIRPADLTEVLRYYHEHPDERAAIGTQEEGQRLLAAVAARRVSASD